MPAQSSRFRAWRESRDPANFARNVASKFDVILARDPLMDQRGDYAGVLAKLRAAVAADCLLVMFSEALMTPAGMARLWDFHGLKRVATDFSRRVHEGIALPMTADQRARAQLALLPQYEFAGREFPALPVAWCRSMEKVGA